MNYCYYQFIRRDQYPVSFVLEIQNHSEWILKFRRERNQVSSIYINPRYSYRIFVLLFLIYKKYKYITYIVITIWEADIGTLYIFYMAVKKILLRYYFSSILKRIKYWYNNYIFTESFTVNYPSFHHLDNKKKLC